MTILVAWVFREYCEELRIQGQPVVSEMCRRVSCKQTGLRFAFGTYQAKDRFMF
jgi:hypothetical protein